MKIVQIDYDRFIDLDDLEFTPDEDLQEYIEQIVSEEVIYGKKIA